MTDLSGLKFAKQTLSGPAFHRSSIDLKEIGDTFLDMSNWKKGMFGSMGITSADSGRSAAADLFVPGVWLRNGRNETL